MIVSEIKSYKRTSSVDKVDRMIKVIDLIRSHAGGIPFWVAGGSVLALDADFESKDYDIYSPDPITLYNNLLKTGYYEIILDSYFAGSLRPVCSTADVDGVVIDKTIQIVTHFHPKSVSEIFESFDFSVVQMATDGHLVYRTEQSYEDFNAGRLRVHNMAWPMMSLQRMIKYTQRGFVPNDEDLVKLGKAIVDAKYSWEGPPAQVIAQNSNYREKR